MGDRVSGKEKRRCQGEPQGTFPTKAIPSSPPGLGQPCSPLPSPLLMTLLLLAPGQGTSAGGNEEAKGACARW